MGMTFEAEKTSAPDMAIAVNHKERPERLQKHTQPCHQGRRPEGFNSQVEAIQSLTFKSR